VLKAHFEASDVSMSKVFYASDGESVVYSGGGGVPGLIQREVNPQATSCALLVSPLTCHRCPEGFDREERMGVVVRRDHARHYQPVRPIF
jgi:hypothetical protein